MIRLHGRTAQRFTAPPKASFSENSSVQSTSAAHEIQGHGTAALLTFGDTQGLVFSQETAHTTYYSIINIEMRMTWAAIILTGHPKH